MMMETVVIGNGVAGEAACSAIRSRTKEIKITLISEDPYPFYSPCILTQYISRDLKRSQVFLKTLRDYEKEGINVLLGSRVDKINPVGRTVFLNEREIAYDKLILATGSRPIVPDMEGIQKKGVRVLKSMRDADRLVRARGGKAIVVGSGPIGVELAIALRKKGWEVCLIEVLDWILPGHFDRKASLIVRNILERQGIEVLTSEMILSIDGRTHVNGVMASRTGRHTADMVVFTIGMHPSTELARGAGVEIGELGGIRVSDEMETSINDIYACGDCVEGRDPFTLRPKLSLLWPHAERQGTVAGFNCVGEHCSVRWMPDSINLDVFGKFAGAMGQPARKVSGEVRLLEKEDEERYCCLVISEGTLIGAQFIGDHDGIGILWPLLGRSYQEICQRAKDEEMMARFPWHHPVKNLFF